MHNTFTVSKFIWLLIQQRRWQKNLPTIFTIMTYLCTLSMSSTSTSFYQTSFTKRTIYVPTNIHTVDSAKQATRNISPHPTERIAVNLRYFSFSLQLWTFSLDLQFGSLTCSDVYIWAFCLLFCSVVNRTAMVARLGPEFRMYAVAMCTITLAHIYDTKSIIFVWKFREGLSYSN